MSVRDNSSLETEIRACDAKSAFASQALISIEGGTGTKQISLTRTDATALSSNMKYINFEKGKRGAGIGKRLYLMKVESAVSTKAVPARRLIVLERYDSRSKYLAVLLTINLPHT
jgi:hypothetical protein